MGHPICIIEGLACWLTLCILEKIICNFTNSVQISFIQTLKLFFFHEQYDGVNGKMFWWLMKKNNFWLWAGWVASYLQRSLSAQVNGGPVATPDLLKQPFSVVRASGGYPGNGKLFYAYFKILSMQIVRKWLRSIHYTTTGEEVSWILRFVQCLTWANILYLSISANRSVVICSDGHLSQPHTELLHCMEIWYSYQWFSGAI